MRDDYMTKEQSVSPEAYRLTYKEHLKDMVGMACKDGNIGAMPMRELLLEAARDCLNTAQNTITINSSLEFWMKNFKDNLKTLPEGAQWVQKSRRFIPTIVIGAGPSVTDDQIKTLCNFHGITIATNKSLSKCLKNGIEPDFVAVLHTTEDIAEHFRTKDIMDFIAKKGSPIESTFLLTTCLHPSTVRATKDISYGGAYWCNPAVPEEQVENVNRMMSLLSDLPCIDTGGNVGIFALISAIQMGYGPIGILGLEHAFLPDKSWTVEKALGYRFEWNPECDQLYAITPSFQVYLDTLVKYYNYMKAQGVPIFNLTPFGPLYARKKELMPYMDIEQFIKAV
jgi:hypothetical protein